MKYIKLFEDNIDYVAIFDDNYLLIDLNDIGYNTRAEVGRSRDLFKFVKDDKIDVNAFNELSKTYIFNFEFDSLKVYIHGEYSSSNNIWGNIKVDICKEPILFTKEFLELQGFIFEYLQILENSNHLPLGTPTSFKSIEDISKVKIASYITLIFRLPNSKSRLIKSPIPYPKFNN